MAIPLKGDDNENLIILIDGIEHPISIVQPEITRLKIS
jgi:hypothetical protein